LETNKHAKHQKHAKLTKPNLGHYARLEFSFMGTTCSTVQNLVRGITEGIDSYSIAYIDSDHKAFDNDERPEYLKSGSDIYLADKINYQEFNRKGQANDFEKKILFQSCDLVLVNGNHARAAQQVLILDSSKTESLIKRIDQLQDLTLILDKDGHNNVPDIVKEKFTNWQSIPRFELTDLEAIRTFFAHQVALKKPKLKGLVLAGGKSVRMGEDKGQLNWWGKAQREHMADLLSEQCSEVFISCRRKQLDEIESDYELLADKYLGLGPYGAILSAFQHDPNSAWLVVACDLPLIDSTAIKYLVEHRKTNAVATVFHNTATDFPDPLCTIWEPKSYLRLLEFLSLGYSCPRKVLINSEIELVNPIDPSVLENANTPEDRERILRNSKSIHGE